MKKTILCPCNSSESYEECCGIFISGKSLAPTSEKLMRSRYSAYVMKEEQYLLDTWHETTRPKALNLEQDMLTKWIGLEVIATNQGEAQDDFGTVEFIARYKVNGKAERFSEISRFCKENGKWYYLDGELS